MDGKVGGGGASMVESLFSPFRTCVGRVLSAGPMPDHIAFIMDGNRRFARKKKKVVGEGHRAGYGALSSMLRYCYELGIKHVTVYAFSIDNFNRSQQEVSSLMDLLQEKLRTFSRHDLVKDHGVRVRFVGDLTLLDDRIRATLHSVASATAANSLAVLTVCLAYTSTDEIARSVMGACTDCGADGVCLSDIERRISVLPDPDILIRSSGETRLSNFLLWQTGSCLLYSPRVLWPDIGFRHLLWAILIYQRHHSYLLSKRHESSVTH